MRIGIKSALSFFLFLIPAIFPSLRAQGLPSLPKASEVVTGTLPNGISYYLVTNPAASKGFADFALVQKGAVSEETARGVLTSLPHFQETKPYQFLAKLGVGYSDYGFIKSSDHSTSYHFKDVPVSRQADRDTVLLMLFDISETCPYEQAIVVSGDIDKATVQERMNVFSMMVTPRGKSPAAPQFEWSYPQEAQVERIVDPRLDLSEIEVGYLSARTPRELMNTAQPLVTEMFSRELGRVLCSRLERAFREADIPVAQVSSSYRSSADGPAAEKYSLSVSLAEKDILPAVRVISSALAAMDAGGASLQEFKDAKRAELSDISARGEGFSNAEWTDRCGAAFLYGASLASRGSVVDFFSSRNVEPSRELSLFNDFSSALLDPSKALKITFKVTDDSLDPFAVADAFSEGWSSAQPSRNYASSPADTLSLYSPKGKSKISKTSSEPMTGGQTWTFANGMKVIYKQDASQKGSFSYGFMLRGGYAQVPSIKRGEGGFVSDILTLSDVAGMSPDAFASLLRSSGITMTSEVGVGDLRLTGSAPSSSFQLLLKSLVSISRERTPDPGAYEYYRKCEALRLSRRSVDPMLDSIASPDYVLTPVKDPAALSEDLQTRAEKYFEKRFSKCDDGYLVLVGDLDPYMLKKVLPKMMSGFRTGGPAPSSAPLQYSLRSGWSTYTFDTEEEQSPATEPCIETVQTVRLPLSSQTLFSFEVAALELKKALGQALGEDGMYVEVLPEASVSPVEQISVRIRCRRCEESGLPLGVTPQATLKALGTVRSVLSELPSSLSKESVEDSKALLLSRLDASSRSDLIASTLLRYSAGKDLRTDYKSKINSVTPASVAQTLKDLEGGGRIEIVIY